MSILCAWISGKFPAYLKSLDGNVMVVTALAAVPIIAIAGVAIDYGRISSVKAELQQTADAAVLAAASARNMPSDVNGSITRRQQIASNYVSNSISFMEDASLASAPVVKVTGNEIEVTLRAEVEGSLASILDFNGEDAETAGGSAGDAAGDKTNRNLGITVSSKAGWSTAANYICMLALNGSGPSALSVSGTADIKADNCSIQVNSSSNTALTQSGSSTVKASGICVAGSYSGSGFSPKPMAGCSAFNDPLAAKFDADYKSEFAKAPVRYSHSSSLTFPKTAVTLQPGLYQGGMRVDSGVTLNLQPGTYFIKDGALEIRSGGSVNGTGVTIVFTGNANSILFVIAGGNINIKAPASGSFAGLAIAQHPMVLPSMKYSNTVIGGGQLNLEGIVYMPKQNFYVTGNGTGTVSNLSTTAKQFSIVADTITIQGNGQLNIGQSAQHDAAGLPALPTQPGGSPNVSLMK